MLLLKRKKGRGGGNIPINPGSGSGGGGGGGSVSVSLPLSVERLVTGSGITLVSNGHLLKPGQLFVADLAKVRVFVLGVEQSIFIKALEGRHVDGSIRSILVQFNYNLVFGTPVVGELRLGETRLTVDIGETPVTTIPGFSTWTGSLVGSVITKLGYPDAVALITDTTHLLNTQAFSPTISSAAATALGSYFATVETQKESFGDGYWNQVTLQNPLSVDSIVLCDQYDRAHWHAVEWARRASSKWFQRACTYRYLTHNVYDGIKMPIDHHKHPKGQALLYWLTGFDPYRTRVHDIGLADFNATMVPGSINHYGNRAMYAGEARPMSILMDMWMENHRLGFVDKDWADVARQAMRRSLGLDPVNGTHSYNTSGLYSGAWTCPKALGGGIQATQNFMNAMLAMSLIRYYDWFATPAEQATIETALNLFCNYNDSQYRDQASTRYISEGIVRDPSTGVPSFAGEPTKSFSYVSSSYSQGGPSKAVDLNGFYPAVYSWVAWKHGQVSRKALADALYETLQRTPHDGNTGPFMFTGSFTAIKQFNEVFFQSMHHLYYRSL